MSAAAAVLLLPAPAEKQISNAPRESSERAANRKLILLLLIRYS